MVEQYARWILGHRILVILISIITVIGLAKGAGLLHFTNDYRVFFGEDNPQLQAFETLQNTYTKNDNVLFVLAPKDGKVFTRETLRSVQWLTEQSWQTPYSIRVDSLSNFQYTYAEADDLVVEDLFYNADALSDEDIQRIKEVALTEPLLVNRLISPRAHVTGVNVTVQLPEINMQTEGVEVVTFSRDLVEQLRANNPNLDIYLTGMIMMNNSFSESAQRDMQTLVPGMFLVVIVVLGLLLRAFTATMTTVLVIMFTIMSAMGLAGWMGIALTPPSASAPTIILTLAVAHCVHILVTFLHSMRDGLDKIEAMVESLRINFQPVFLTSVTTAIGFLTMNFSDVPPFHDLGNIVAMGVVIAFLLSVTFLPAAVTLLPVRVKLGQTKGRQNMERFAEFVVQRRKQLLWGMTALVVILVAMIPKNELNDEFIKYFDETVNFRTATDFSSENLTGLYTNGYSLNSGEVGGISNPDFMNNVEEFAIWYNQQPEVLHVNTFTDIMKRLNKNLHGNDPAWYRIPDQRNLSAQYLLLYEMSLPYGLDLNNQINVDKSATRFTVTLKNLSTKQMLGLEERAQQWLKDNVPLSMQVAGSSPTMMFSFIGERNIRSMLLGTTLALVIISLILIVALRSIKIGLISMVPNLVPAAMAFGIWGLFVGEVGLGLSIVMGMTLGIVVDDTVHFLSKYLRARREEGKSPPEAVRYAFSTVGVALWVTSLVLVAGFLVLTFSSFKLNSAMGLLTAITIAIALLADFLLLPPLLMKVEEITDVKAKQSTA